MTVDELIELLSEIPGDTEVRIASQPSWPVEHEIAGIHLRGPVCDMEDAPPPCCFIIEGDQLGYLDAHVSKAIGWRK